MDSQGCHRLIEITRHDIGQGPKVLATHGIECKKKKNTLQLNNSVLPIFHRIISGRNAWRKCLIFFQFYVVILSWTVPRLAPRWVLLRLYSDLA